MADKLTVPLGLAEREALSKVARAEMRPLREQARWFTRQELERLGLLLMPTGPASRPTWKPGP